MREFPFPYLVMDSFLPNELAERAWQHFPNDGWKTTENQHTVSKSVLRGTIAPKEARPVFEHLSSIQTLARLSVWFSIKGLLPDPYFAEAGFHRIGRGGFLDIHADFSHHDITGLERRLNLILYLNKDWKEEYGGNLKLYDQDLKPQVEIMPVFNRAVIFETSDISYHGHPDPLNCPDGEFRKSIALYYYTLPRPERVRKSCFFPTDPKFIHRA